MQIEEIIKAFLPHATFNYKQFGSGHIHDTFKISINEPSKNCFLLQCINQHVFQNVIGMMQNIDLVTAYLQQQLQKNPIKGFTTTQILPTATGKLYYKDATGKAWRMYSFIDNTVAYDKVTSIRQAEEAGKAYGVFQYLLSDLPSNKLVTTIPDFHNMAFRLKNLKAAKENNAANRLKEVTAELTFVESRADEMLHLYSLIETKKIPNRVSHNDTKFNNVLLDADTHQAKAVIDLDTVMPGSTLYDFGDAVRTICNTCEEDEPNTEIITFSLSFFEAFTKHYLAQTEDLLTQIEIDFLVTASRYMTFIMGVRFLIDYLEGDIYYKTIHPKHNLDRARSQFKLVNCMEEKNEEMVKVVEKFSS